MNNCPFCHAENLINMEASFDDIDVCECNKCSETWTVEYTEKANPKCHYIALYNEYYLFDLDLNRETTGFFDLSLPDGQELCFKVKNLLPINPSNADYWIGKLLNLRAFS